MLVIREEQFHALGMKWQLKWEIWLLECLQTHYPEDWKRMGEADSRELVRHTVMAASRMEIGAEHGLTGLLGLYVEFGRELELAPYRQWALRLFQHPKLPGSFKVHLVRERLQKLTRGRRMVLHQEPE